MPYPNVTRLAELRKCLLHPGSQQIMSGRRYFISSNFTVLGAIKTNKQQETEKE
jgi:hypothetical protein